MSGTPHTSTTTAAARQVPRLRAAAGPAERVLPQIQALRALAVMAVIVFHLWPDVVPGGYVGVDVFFVVSGYLITGHLARSLEGSGRISLASFWARRARRLLPLALLVLGATLLTTVLVTPETQWRQLARDTAAAAGYSLNWLQAADTVDYFAAEEAASAVQHYWTLSVEEQFYLAWPLLLTAVAWFGRRRWPGTTRRRIVLATSAIVVLSFSHSVLASASAPEAAYFSTFTHAWEFGLGGLVFVWTRGRSAAAVGRGIVRAAVSWAGVAAILGASLAFDATTPFPSWRAAIPVVGALAVIVAGTARGPLGSGAVFERWSVQRIGDLSYGAYLWHWPLIVLGPDLLGRPLRDADRFAILVATLALAAASKRLVEDPVRFGRTWAALKPRLPLLMAATGCVLTIGLAAAVLGIVDRRADAAAGRFAELTSGVLAGDERCFGALAMDDPSRCPDHHRIDGGVLLASATAFDPGEGELERLTPGLTHPRYGPADAPVRIALVGDSHAEVYLPPLVALARLHGWAVYGVIVRDCSPSTPTWESFTDADQRPDCIRFRTTLFEELASADLDLIVTSSVSPRYAMHETIEQQAVIAQAFDDMWTAWAALGTPVAVIADVPGPGLTGHECLDASRRLLDPCTSTREAVLERDPMVVAATELGAPVTLIDLTDAYCDDVCHMVVGGIPVYASGAHISSGFAMSLAPRLEARLLGLLGQSSRS